MVRDINLSDVVKQVVGQLKLSADSKSIRLENEIKSGLFVYADKQALLTILRNLVNNAVKYSHENSYVWISAREEGDKVIVSVKDDGIGMKEETQKSVFSIARNKSEAGTGKEQGSGLGLALCKELVEKQGEEIWFESRPDAGSIFYFSIKKST